jgi:hypothetical protein
MREVPKVLEGTVSVRCRRCFGAAPKHVHSPVDELLEAREAQRAARRGREAA